VLARAARLYGMLLAVPACVSGAIVLAMVLLVTGLLRYPLRELTDSARSRLHLDAATVLTDTLFLNAEGNANAVFVIKINGAFSTSTYAKVVLRNGAQSKNVFWKIEGAVTINNHSTFRGTLVCNNGALGAINTGVTVDGRAFTTTGALTTTAINTTMVNPCNALSTDLLQTIDTHQAVSVYPNPFTATVHIASNGPNRICVFRLYNVLGIQVMNTVITDASNAVDTKSLPAGIYHYNVTTENGTVHSGKLVSQN